MVCRRCPHHVRHGQVGAQNKIEFKDMCGLRMKTGAPTPCTHFPFPSSFDYVNCATYQDVFKTSILRNDVVPTKDFQYSDALTSSSITEMELL